MLASHDRLDRAWLALLGLFGAVACGPAPHGSADDAGTSDAAPTATGGPATSDPTTGTMTANTTSPSECETHQDCGFCGYCLLGVCEHPPGCCEGDAGPAGERASGCSPPERECYFSDECPEGHVCIEHVCTGVVPTRLPLCPPQAVELSQWNLDAPASALVLHDVDGDGDLDVVAALPSLGRIQLALNDGAGGFTPGDALAVGGPATDLALAVGDVNGDGDGDLAVARRDGPAELTLLFGQGAEFIPVMTESVPGPRDVFIADLDGDALADVMVAGDGIAAWFGDGEGGFPASGSQVPFIDPAGVCLVDATLDGRPDLLAPVDAGKAAHVLVGEDGWGYSSHAILEPGSAPLAMVLAASLAPAAPPAIVAVAPDDAAGAAFVWNPVGPGEWAELPTAFAVMSPLLGGLFADLDADGTLDLLSATLQPTLAVLAGDGQGGFACERVHALAAPSSPDVVAVGDVDGDGDVDIVAGSRDAPVVSVLR